MENKTPREILKPILQNWKRDYTFKTIASSLLSFGITILFALYNGFLGIRLLSVWNGSICVFYLLLVLIRGTILFAERKSKGKPDSEKAHIRYKVFVISTIMLLLLNTLIMVNSTKSGTDNMFTLSAISSAVIYIIIVFITLRLLTAGMKQHRKGIDSTNKS